MSCRLWVNVAVLASVAWLPTGRVVAQEKQLQEIDEATRKKWAERSFWSGYMGVDTNGILVFAAQADGLRSVVPAFRYDFEFWSVSQQRNNMVELHGLPQPKVPFGLWIVAEGRLENRPARDSSGPIEAIAGLQHLTHLRLKGRFQNADMETVAELASLTHLDLRDTSVSGPGLKRLAGLRGITHLNLRVTQIPGPWLKYLVGHERLTELSVKSIGSDDLKHLAPLKKLARLTIEKESGFDLPADGMKHLAELPALAHLELLDCKMTDDGWKQLRALPALTSFSYYQAHPTADDYQQIAEFKGLTTLSLKVSVHHAELKHLAGLANLTRLELPNAPSAEEVKLHLSGLTKLTSLRVGSQATAESLKQLSQFKGLTDLSLGGSVQDELLQHLAGIPNLTRLELDEVQIKGDGLAHLSNFPKLTSLTLTLWDLPQVQMKDLAGLTKLTQLDVRFKHNPSFLPKVTEADVTALRKALPKCKVVVHGELSR